MMTTREVAAYLRIKERKVYDLVSAGKIPCSRVTGKWLFPKDLIDKWLADRTEHPGAGPNGAAEPQFAAPAVIAGSHDPLLEWALRESRLKLALLPGGSLDGLQRLVEGAALIAGMHVLDADGGYNERAVLEKTTRLPGKMVAVEWAQRTQGIVTAANNPLKLGEIRDLARKGIRVIARQAEAGSQILLDHLLRQRRVRSADIHFADPPARSESDLALAIVEGRADAGIAIEAAARQHRLGFVPLCRERYDLVMRQDDFFAPSVQELLAFGRTEACRVRARLLGGYDVAQLGRVAFRT